MFDHDWQPMNTGGSRFTEGSGNRGFSDSGNRGYDNSGNGGNGGNSGNRGFDNGNGNRGYSERRTYNRGNSGGGNGNGNANSNNNAGGNRTNSGKFYSQGNISDPNVDMILKEEAYNVVGSAINILNDIGPSLSTDVYLKSLKVEFKLREIPHEENQAHELLYKEVVVGSFTTDLIAYESVIIDVKIIDAITDLDIAQMVNKLKASGLKAGLIFNFKYPKLQWQRVIV